MSACPPLIAIPLGSPTDGATSLYALGAAYVAAIYAAGGVPVLLPPDDDPTALVARLDAFDGLLLAGGGDVLPEFYGQSATALVQGVDRARDLTEIALVQAALERGMPLLSICRGAQLLCIAAGGTLHQDIQTNLPCALDHRHQPGRPRDHLSHTVALEHSGQLAWALGLGVGDEVHVNSRHHQAVDTPPPDFCAAARAPDGVIEALELASSNSAFALGVQWHPEDLASRHDCMASLFRALVRRAAQP